MSGIACIHNGIYYSNSVFRCLCITVGPIPDYNLYTFASFITEPKYADPISGSSVSFQSRLAELASLEAETVRWEMRMRKGRKKPKED